MRFKEIIAVRVIKHLAKIAKKGLDDNLSVYAAQAAYYLVLSAIPFIMILLSVLQFFIPIDKTEFISRMPSFFSSEIDVFLRMIIDEIFSKPTISLISVSALTTLWSASRGFSAVERGVKKVYKIPKKNKIVADTLLSFVYTIAFTAVIVLFLGFVVFEKTLFGIVNEYISIPSINISFIKYILFLAVTIVFFMVLYTVFTNKKGSVMSHLPGAVFTGAGWILFSYIFSIYINNFANYSRIYGSLTAIILMMLWIYCCMIILLYGAEINMDLTNDNT